jgi:hypothetical protein
VRAEDVERCTSPLRRLLFKIALAASTLADPSSHEGSPTEKQLQFVRDFDLEYAERRLRFLIAGMSWLYRDVGTEARPSRQELDALKERLYEAVAKLEWLRSGGGARRRSSGACGRASARSAYASTLVPTDSWCPPIRHRLCELLDRLPKLGSVDVQKLAWMPVQRVEKKRARLREDLVDSSDHEERSELASPTGSPTCCTLFSSKKTSSITWSAHSAAPSSPMGQFSTAGAIRPAEIPARRHASPTASSDAASKTWKHVSSSGRNVVRT